MKRQLAFALLLSCAGAAAAQPTSGIFEQAAPGRPAAWRARVGGTEMLILPNGFVIRGGRTIHRFRWDRSMELLGLEPEGLLPGSSYVLKGRSAVAESLPHAARVRAMSRDGQVSILYYFGPRGPELDIEVAPGRRPPLVRLVSVDGDFSLDRAGRLMLAGVTLTLAPAAYTVEHDGRHHSVRAEYELEDARHATISVGGYDPEQRLAIDPVMTYATYFAGSLDEEMVAMREMADGSLLLAGTTNSIDLPQGISLTTILLQPSVAIYARCFVARVSPADKQIRFVSYLDGSNNTSCSVDVDGSGRILVSGMAEYGSANLTTGNAEHPVAVAPICAFLARLSADGKTLEYSTYLDFNAVSLPTVAPLMRAGPGDTVYFAQQYGQKVYLARYSIAARRFDQKTAFGDQLTLNGIEMAPGGALCVFGITNWPSLPVKGAFQTTPPVANAYAGFVAAFSPDLQTLLFCSYLGGQKYQGTTVVTSIDTVLPKPDGTLWLFGLAQDGSIPDVTPAHPFPPPGPFSGIGWAPFMIQVLPGTTVFRKAFWAAGYGFMYPGNPVGGMTLADGRDCMVAVNAPSAGSAVVGADGGSQLACLNASGDDLQLLTLLGSAAQTIAVPSRLGGVWSLQGLMRSSTADVIPPDFKSAAIQPSRPNVYPGSDESLASADLVLRYIDLKTPNPVLASPQPLRLLALQGNVFDSFDLAGRNFAWGMQLSFADVQVPLTLSSPTSASLRYTSPSLNLPPNGQPLSLRAGNYTGRLVIPVQPQAASSEPFPVIVGNLAPAPTPLSPTSDPRLFDVVAPIYDDSQILWNGASLAMIPSGPKGGPQVRIPAGSSSPGTGEFMVINQRPGGGVQRETVSIGNTSSSVVNPIEPVTVVAGDAFQVDRTRKVLYTISGSDLTTGLPKSEWTIAAYRLPETSPFQSRTVPKNGATLLADFKLSTDGSYLYFGDNLLRITRFRTDALQQDLQFQVTTDAPPVATSPVEKRFNLRVLDDAPETLLVVTPAGQMVLYDRDQPRPYSTVDFRDPVLRALDPVLATTSYVYALPRAEINSQAPCVVRYYVDALGFGPPEDFCNPGTNWGKYPEMKVYAGVLVLQNDYGAVGVRLAPASGAMRLSGSFDANHDLVSTAVVNPLTGTTFRLAFTGMSTGEPVGHFPRRVWRAELPSSVVLLDDTMVYLAQPLVSGFPSGPPRVVVVPQWQSAMEVYP